MSEKTLGRGDREGSRLLILVLSLTFAAIGAVWALIPAAASADDSPVNCSGSVKADKGSIFPDSYSYSFGCNKNVYAISLVSNREIDLFATEVIGLKPDGEPGDGEDFFCVGGVPAFGFGCYGTPGRDPETQLAAGNKLQGTFTLSNPICDANAQPQISGVALLDYPSIHDLVDPPSIRKWKATTETIALNTSAIRCKVLNPKAKAKKKAKAVCAKVKKAKNRKAKAAAKRKCSKAKAAVRSA